MDSYCEFDISEIFYSCQRNQNNNETSEHTKNRQSQNRITRSGDGKGRGPEPVKDPLHSCLSKKRTKQSQQGCVEQTRSLLRTSRLLNNEDLLQLFKVGSLAGKNELWRHLEAAVAPASTWIPLDISLCLFLSFFSPPLALSASAPTSPPSPPLPPPPLTSFHTSLPFAAAAVQV